MEISSTALTFTSGSLREGVSGQSVVFNLQMSPTTNSGAVSGSNLWRFTAFGSADSAGINPTTSTFNVGLNGQGNVGVTPGSQSSFSGLNFPLDLSGNINCDDVPYICVTAAKGPSASPDFTLSGVPNDDIFTTCRQVTCRGKHLNYLFYIKPHIKAVQKLKANVIPGIFVLVYAVIAPTCSY